MPYYSPEPTLVDHDSKMIDGFMRVHMHHLVDFDQSFWERFLGIVALRMYGYIDWRLQA